MTKQRKYTAYLVTLAVISAGLFANALTGAEYVSLVKVCLSAFVIGNVASKFRPGGLK